MKQTLAETNSVESLLGRRITTREVPPRSHCFTLEYNGGIVIGALLDYTPGGLGMETYEPLEVGQQITLTGTIEINGCWKRLHGQALVVRCERKGEACYRLGLAGNNWGWRSTIDPNSPVLQRPARYSSV